MPEGRSSLSAAGFFGGLCRQHLGDGVQTLRQHLLSKGSRCLRVGQSRSVPGRYGQRHSEIHVSQGDHFGRGSWGQRGARERWSCGLDRCNLRYCFLNKSFSVTRWPVSNVPVVDSVICCPSAETTHLSFCVT